VADLGADPGARAWGPAGRLERPADGGPVVVRRGLRYSASAMAHPTKRPLRETLEALLIAALFLRFANTFVVQTFYIPSPSMVQTLLVGDHLFVNRFIYGPATSDLEKRLLPQRGIQRGDIVVFRSPETPKMDLVKRCIGLPGDTIEVVSKQLFINGQEVDDASYAIHRDPLTRLRPPRDYYGPYTVPEDHYFCMGDNRDESYDSRYWGPLPKQLVKGRAVMIYWSYGGETPDGEWHGWGQKLGHIGKTLIGFPAKTRWDRTFQVIH
jgi:signal peptidase I